MGRDIVVRLLGPVRLRAGDTWQVPASPQLRLILGLMVLRIGQVVPVAELVDAIWEDEPPRSARASLQALMTRLRRLLKPLPGAALTRCGDGYLLEFDQDLVDAERSRSLGRAARAAPWREQWTAFVERRVSSSPIRSDDVSLQARQRVFLDAHPCEPEDSDIGEVLHRHIEPVGRVRQ